MLATLVVLAALVPSAVGTCYYYSYYNYNYGYTYYYYNCGSTISAGDALLLLPHVLVAWPGPQTSHLQILFFGFIEFFSHRGVTYLVISIDLFYRFELTLAIPRSHISIRDLIVFRSGCRNHYCHHLFSHRDGCPWFLDSPPYVYFYWQE